MNPFFVKFSVFKHGQHLLACFQVKKVLLCLKIPMPFQSFFALPRFCFPYAYCTILTGTKHKTCTRILYTCDRSCKKIVETIYKDLMRLIQKLCRKKILTSSSSNPFIFSLAPALIDSSVKLSLNNT